MQSVGLQTVLQMSNAAERVQAVAQSGTVLAGEQAREQLEKQHIRDHEEVQLTQKTEEGKIREEDQRKGGGGQQRERSAGERREQAEEAPRKMSPSDGGQGTLLNIRV